MNTEIWRLLESGEALDLYDEQYLAGWQRHHADSGSKVVAGLYRRRVSILTLDEGWISVKDRLPTKEDGDEYGFVGVFGNWTSTKQVIWSYNSVSRDTKATHWRKLPPPPPPPELSAKEKALKEWQGASNTSHEDIAWVAGWEACEKAMKA